MKKLFKALIVLTLMITVTGCGKREPNSRRRDNYTFDFVDYIDIIAYGESGDGYIEIRTKDISVKDFSSEEDYINVKSDLDTLNLNYLQGRNQPSGSSLIVSKSTGLSNGDMIQIGIKSRKELKSDMNTETYDYVVENLQESTPIDLFDSKFVTFYAREDGKFGFHIKDDMNLPAELISNLRYSITTDDKLEVDKTIMHITAGMDEEFLKTNEYYNINVFLAKHNLKSEIEADKVLQYITSPIEIGSANSSMIEASLNKEIYKYETSLAKVCNLQQLSRQKVSEPYSYIVVYYNDNLGQREYWRRMVNIVLVDDEYIVNNVGAREATTEEYATKAFDSSEMLLNFMMGDEIPVEEPTPEPTEEVVEEVQEEYVEEPTE